MLSMADILALKKDHKAKSNADEMAGTIANRRTPRRAHERVVGILFKGKYTLMRSLQISEGGMLLELSRAQRLSDVILVTLLIPKSLIHIMVSAEIIYQMDEAKDKDAQLANFGVRFIGLEASKKRLIRDYISSKSKAEMKDVFEH